MLTTAKKNPQTFIDEWNDMGEQEQYNMLKYNIISASKRFNRAYTLELESPDELVGVAWLSLQGILNTEHIQSIIDRRAETITLNFIVFTAASNMLTHIMYDHKRKHKEYGNSLNNYAYKNDDTTEVMDILPDKNSNIENQVISQIMVDDTLKDIKPKHQTIMKYVMEGCTNKEISSMTGIKTQAIAKCLYYIRKKLGREESGTGKPRAINFDRFSKAYEMVLAKKVKPGILRNEFDISETTYRRFVNRYRHEHGMPMSPYYQKLYSQC